MDYQFMNKRAVITGASSGIGAGIAKAFAKMGVKVVLTARRRELLQDVAEEIERSGETSFVIPGDVTKREDIVSVVKGAVNKMGGVDVMVNCAGLGGPKYFEEESPEQFRRHIEINYLGTVEYCRQVVPIMKEQGCGYILNIGSVSSLMGFPTYTSYSASKAAILRFSDSLRHEVKKYGIIVSVACPSLVSTAMVHDHWEDHGKWVRKFKMLEVEKAVDYIIKGMRKRKFIILDLPDVKLMYLLYRIFPETFTKLFTWLYKIE